MKQRGFTLIELMFVVGLIALLTGVVLPLAIGHLQSAPEKNAPQLAQAALTVEPVEAVRQPTTESSSFFVELRARQELEGWQVRTRYHARVEAIYVIRNHDGHELRLAFPFPSGMTEARSVSLAKKENDGWVEPTGVSYDLGAIRWLGEVEPGEEITLRVSYESEGRDAFVYDVAGSGRTGSVMAEMTLSGVERPIVSAHSLPPTAISGGKIVWSFDRLLTNERIRVELPPGPSPLGRMILLCQLAALAVLLFGAGFWYLSELDRPGRLDNFRWGHFFLLAGNHSLFFAVVAFAGDPRIGISVGALVSLPLLYVHTSRFTDAKFARTRVVPLAALTLALVVVAVYLPWLRPALALSSGALGAAFVTLTYRNFSARRLQYRETQREAAAQKRWEEAMRPLVERLDDLEREGAPVARLREIRDLEKLKARLDEVERAFRHAQNRDRPAHCLACGAPGDCSQKHCPSCGAPRPAELACARCGDVTRLPVHLLRKNALGDRIFCAGCGTGLD